MNTIKLWAASVAVAVLLAGCGGAETMPSGDPNAVSSTRNGDFEDIGGSTSGIGDDGGSDFVVFDGMQPGDGELIQNNLIVYFEFDSSEIRADFNPMLAAHGRYLASDPNLVVRLEGHTDERGSREYNIGLGERRAQAVRQLLQLQGAQASQLSTVSYGEERPAVFGSDDEAYSLNRRVEIVY
jgi:peptidoglycan-associated lipoprotein